MNTIQAMTEMQKLTLDNISVDFTVKSMRNDSALIAMITVFNAELNNVSLYIYSDNDDSLNDENMEQAIQAITTDNFDHVSDTFELLKERN